jgi:hypothetical protein
LEGGRRVVYLDGEATWTRASWDDAARRLVIEPGADGDGAAPAPRMYRVEVLPEGTVRDVEYRSRRVEIGLETRAGQCTHRAGGTLGTFSGRRPSYFCSCLRRMSPKVPWPLLGVAMLAQDMPTQSRGHGTRDCALAFRMGCAPVLLEGALKQATVAEGLG